MTFNKTINNYSITEKEKKQIDAKIKVLNERMNTVETTANATASVVESIVTGDGETIVPVASGGTSATTSTEARNELLGDIPEIVSEITDDTLIAGVYPDEDITSGKIGKRTISSIYNYIKQKFVRDNIGTGSNIDRSDTDPTSIADTFDAIEDDIDGLTDDVSDIGTDVAAIKDLIPEGATSSNQLVDNSSMTTALTNGLATKQNTLTAGSNIDITGNVISANIANVYIYCGSVASYADLPSTGLRVGDVYNVEDTEMNYGWTGTAWDQLGANAVIADNAVTTNKLANNAVTTAKINDGAVTLPKVADEVVSYDVGYICTTVENVQDKEITVGDNFVLKAGVILKVLFTNKCTISSPNIKIVDSNNTVIATKEIKTILNSSKVSLNAKTLHYYTRELNSAWTYHDEQRVWNGYTTFELIYDGTDFVIMGNPVLMNGQDVVINPPASVTDNPVTASYTVYANGFIEQWGNTTSVNQNSSQTSTFPIGFTSSSSWAGSSMNINSKDSSSFVKLYPSNDGLHFYPISVGYSGELLSWIAIGY